MAKELAKAAEAISAIVSATDAKAAQIQKNKLSEAEAKVLLKMDVSETAAKIAKNRDLVLELHDGINAKLGDALDDALKDAIRAGEALMENKKLVPHGEWEKWMGKNLPVSRISDRTAQIYMNCAKNKDELLKKHAELKMQNSVGLSINAAQKELRRKKNTKKRTNNRTTTGKASVDTVGTVQWFVELSATLRQIVQNPTPLSSTIDAGNRAAIAVAIRELQWSAATITGAVAPLFDADPEAKPHQYPDWLKMVERQLVALIAHNTFAELGAAAMQNGSADSTLKIIRSIKGQLNGLESIISEGVDIQQPEVISTKPLLEGGAAAAAAHA